MSQITLLAIYDNDEVVVLLGLSTNAVRRYNAASLWLERASSLMIKKRILLKTNNNKKQEKKQSC